MNILAEIPSHTQAIRMLETMKDREEDEDLLEQIVATLADIAIIN